ncbi:Tyrosine-protein phosphatase YwqE [Gemmata obscuriglobus]|uniref:protein-tyrosine-phosphatase n=1 Tax=Gemmata obscuriglobus TaxID=114 RepID=A0A2Z3HFH0_9BACT
MTLLVDTHVHLLAGLDDGPTDTSEALAMCRLLAEEGATHVTALAHQNESYPENTTTKLRLAATHLASQLKANGVPLAVHPTGEVALTPDLEADFRAGRLLSIGDHGQFLLVEMPPSGFVDVRPLAGALRRSGVRLVVAHAERYPELLHDPETVDDLAAAGCLIQVTAGALAEPPSGTVGRALRDWAKRGVIHLLGSDGHRMTRRRPHLRAGYEALARCAGRAAADRAGIWGAAILQGLPVKVPAPAPRARSWYSELFR